LASPGPIDVATSATETGRSNCLTEPSGSVIATIPQSSSRRTAAPAKKKCGRTALCRKRWLALYLAFPRVRVRNMI
jgi:hypothetical protein